MDWCAVIYRVYVHELCDSMSILELCLAVRVASTCSQSVDSSRCRHHLIRKVVCRSSDLSDMSDLRVNSSEYI
jgi:hypothetical protein